MQKHFEKGKKDARRSDFRDDSREENRKKKLKPIEKSKYKLKNQYFSDDEE